MTLARRLLFIGDSLIAYDVEELALRHKIGYLDGCRHFSGEAARPPYFLDDGVHLSPPGYAPSGVQS